jgi:hypothetical protein
MRLYAKCFLMAALLTASLALCGQEHQRSSAPNLLARLSFDNSGALQSQESRYICLAVDRDGSYRMMRASGSFRMIPSQEPDWIHHLDGTQRLKGTMSQEQFQQFQTLLGSSDLRSLSGNHGGIVRQSAQIFTAEIPSLGAEVSDSTLRIQWLNGDGANPFPAPVRKMIDWMNHFEPKNAKPAADLEFQNVCPSVGFQLLQPSIASNVP